MKIILDYDEFNIYTTPADVESYIESLIEQGIGIKEEIYDKCISHFGKDFESLIERAFSEEE